MEQIIDTHVHIWNLDELRLPWLDSEGYLNQTFREEDYSKALTSSRFTITGAVYMEVDCRPDDRAKENTWIINQCGSSKSIFEAAVISGNLADEHFQDYIGPYRSKVAGVRQVLHVPERQRGYCLQPQFMENVRFLGEAGLTFDLCMRNEELADGYDLAKACPGTRIILDHVGNPNMEMLSKPLTEERRAYRQRWFENLNSFSDLPNVYCKLSGFSEGRQGGFPDFSEEINRVMDIFGEDKLLYASNFPVINLGGGLSRWTDFLLTLTETRSEGFRRKLFSDNARLVYLNQR